MNTEQKGWRKFDCEELEDIINYVRSGVKDSAHIHSFVRREIERTLQEQREEMVKVIDEIANDTTDLCENSAAFKAMVLSKLSALIKDTKTL